MIKFDVYVQIKEGGVIKSQRLEWHFNRIIDCLHYAIDNFDRKSDVKMTICKGDKIVMTFTNGAKNEKADRYELSAVKGSEH